MQSVVLCLWSARHILVNKILFHRAAQTRLILLRFVYYIEDFIYRVTSPYEHYKVFKITTTSL